MDQAFKRELNLYARERPLFTEYNNVFKHRDIPSYFEDPGLTSKFSHKRDANESKYFFEQNKNQVLEYSMSPFYSMYYSNNKANISRFKALKSDLKDFGITFAHQKRCDEGYIIVLNLLLDEFASEGVQQIEYQRGLEIFEGLFFKDFILNVSYDEKWIEFMRKFGVVMEEFGIFTAGYFKDTKRFVPSLDPMTFPDILNDEEWETASNCSASDPLTVVKEVAPIVIKDQEEELKRFQDTVVEEIKKTEKKLTKGQEFYNCFGETLKVNLESYTDSMTTCFALLRNPVKTSDEILDPIVAALNCDFEAGFFLIENRDTLLEELNKELKQVEASWKGRKKDKQVNIASNFTIKKKKQGSKELQENEKILEALKRLGVFGKDDTEDIEAYRKQLQEKYNKKDDDFDPDQKYDFVEDDPKMLHQKFGMTRKEKGHAIVFDVEPKHKADEFRNTQRLEVKNIFPEHLARIFTDSETLNTLQSKIFDAVYNTDENILCCAPTGAGKTNVALISISRLLQRHVNPATQKIASDFKVVYLSPLKALAAEIVGKFGKKLDFLGVTVRECTGDISLSKAELTKTNIIVSTPEKWDVMTRKSEELNSIISLLIIDEIHLLDEVRGRVLESLVARTVRLIEAKQCRIRLLGLSATLPNYIDVARFLKVSQKGLFKFDESFRPVPLYKKFVGIKKPELVAKRAKETGEIVKQSQNRLDTMNESCYDILRESLRQRKQVLIFVHSRKETFAHAQFLIKMAISKGELPIFCFDNFKGDKLAKLFENRDLSEIVQRGIGCHNAGIKRKDRSNIEKAFIDGSLSVVICTATLAWGINMPCHTVIIKGTDYYEPGFGFKKVSLLDVQQIFGRAGRPQFDKYGEAVLITKSEDLNYFISMLSDVRAIESHFKNFMLEAILAEVVLGNISSFDEALHFMRGTFFNIRYMKNPLAYGVRGNQKPEEEMHALVEAALMELHDLRLARYDQRANVMEPTELGRIASHYYINCETMNTLCTYMRVYEGEEGAKSIEDIEAKNLIGIIAQATEFEQLSSKPEEETELRNLKRDFNWLEVDRGYTDLYNEKVKKSKQSQTQKDESREMFDQLEKIVLLCYGYLSRRKYETYSLESDTTYITENGVRILRCMLGVAIKENNAILAESILVLVRQIENCVPEDGHPLRMFCLDNYIRSVSAKKNQMSEASKFSYMNDKTIVRVEEAMNDNRLKMGNWDVESLRENPEKVSSLYLSKKNEELLHKAIKAFPVIDFFYETKPIAQTILKITIKLKLRFEFVRNWHMKNEHFWIFVCNGHELIHHSQVSFESAKATLHPLNEKSIRQGNFVDTSFFVPVREDVKTYSVKIMSDHFVEADSYADIDLSEMKMSMEKMDFTSLLDLKPLGINALGNAAFESLFPQNIQFFNPIQTQLFWPLYHTNENILIGAPTGSGKTIMAEIAIFRVFREEPGKKVVYIAPYKALVKERLKDWTNRLGTKLRKNVHELSGDHTPNFQELLKSDILVTTPEKWDGITRSWQTRAYVQSVSLMIFDEIHLLGQNRGAVLEIIVSRMNYIGAQLNRKIRMLGLSTAIANGHDVGEWFGVKRQFNFNFRPSVRPVPLEYHFKGFSEPNYCPRMNSMNKPAYNDIKKFSSNAPTLVFVSSRRQTRLTALDLISLSQTEFATRSPYLKMSEKELLLVIQTIKDGVLKQTLTFGIGIHHAGLETSDREIVEHLFSNNKILILVATSTLAWGVNFPAKLVVIKGTEFYDPEKRGWVDMQVSDILQMAGRAGRPQFNEKGFVAVYVENSKKNFFRKYLNDPFPIESNLHPVLEEHISAEIASGSIRRKQDFIDFISWTYFFRRLMRNPSFYQLASTDNSVLQKYLLNLVDNVTAKLIKHGAVETDENEVMLTPTFIGTVASSYYITPKTAFKLNNNLQSPKPIAELLRLLSNTEEYKKVPVRHEEQNLNFQLSKSCPYKISEREAESPNVKTFLLFQAYLSDLPLPIRDYITDTKLVIDSAFRIINAMIDLSAENRVFSNCMHLVQMMQMFVQGCWINESSLLNLPHFSKHTVKELDRHNIQYLCQLIELIKCQKLSNLLKPMFGESQIADIENRLKNIPDISATFNLYKFDSEAFEPITDRSCSLRSGDEAVLELKCWRENQQCTSKVQVKRWAKEKEYAWWVLIGNMERNYLYAIKKMHFGARTTKTVQFDIEKAASRSEERVDVLLMSDSFIGLDQKHEFNLSDYRTPIKH